MPDERCTHCGVPSVADYWKHREVLCVVTVYLRQEMDNGPTKGRIREIESFAQEGGINLDDVYTLLGEVERRGKLLARVLEILEELDGPAD